jgi:hypothetical protein
MGSIQLDIQTAIKPNQVLSSFELKQRYLFGLPLVKNGAEIPDETIDFYIDSAVTMIENYLGVKLTKRVVTETRDFNGDDWRQWGFIKTTYPVVCPISLNGYLGTTKQVQYPKQWLSVRKTSDGQTFSREINIVPTQNSTHNELIIYGGILPQTGLIGAYNTIPNYWNIKYISGFDVIPSDIAQAIGMLASFPILGILGDMLLPWPGVSSRSVSIDGISQSISSYATGQAGIFGARLKQYNDTLFNPQTGGLMAMLKDAYSAIIWSVA